MLRNACASGFHTHEGRAFSPRPVRVPRGLPADPGVLELDYVEEILLFTQVSRRARWQMRRHPHKSNTSSKEEPEVLISSVPTSVSRPQQWGNVRKEAVNTASLENAVKTRNYQANDRKGKMHMVKVKLLDLQPKTAKGARFAGWLTRIVGNWDGTCEVPHALMANTQSAFPRNHRYTVVKGEKST